MKALSIKQPWAWLICAGYKDIENRSWSLHMPPLYTWRGYAKNVPTRIYIHTGLSTSDMIPEVIEFAKERLTILQRLTMLAAFDAGIFHGGIIGEVDITGCVEKSDSLWFVGPFGFTLANPVLYETPIPCKGKLGFFNIPEEVLHGQEG